MVGSILTHGLKGGGWGPGKKYFIYLLLEISEKFDIHTTLLSPNGSLFSSPPPPSLCLCSVSLREAN